MLARIAYKVGPHERWGDFSFLFLPLSVPLETLFEFVDLALPPYGPITYGAELNGQLLSKPTTVEAAPPAAGSSLPHTKVFFDFPGAR